MRSGVWLLALQVTALAAFPRPDGYVSDFASVFTAADEAYLEEFLATLERDTSAEVAVATVGSLDGLTVEEYASRLFAEWRIGKRRDDNGVLLLVAVRDRTVRIEVGYGLEATLPDGLAGEIIRAEMLPEFRAGNVPRGIGRGLDRIARAVRRDAASQPRVPATAAADARPPAAAIVPLLAAFVIVAGFFAGLGIRTRTAGPLLWGGLFGAIPLLIAIEFAAPQGIGALTCAELLAMAAGYRAGRSGYWLSLLRTGKPNSPKNNQSMPWVLGGAAGPSSTPDIDTGGDTSSSSGDFGGGSSGGGGASGHW